MVRREICGSNRDFYRFLSNIFNKNMIFLINVAIILKLRLYLSHCVVDFLGKRSAFYTFNPESRIFQFFES